MNLSRILALSDIILRGHVLNWIWRPRVVRRNVRSRVLTEVLPQYFKRYLPAATNMMERDVVHNDDNEKIFTLWLQGEENAPELVKACFRSIRRHCKQELVVLDENTIFDYITLPEEIMDIVKSQNANI